MGLLRPPRHTTPDDLVLSRHATQGTYRNARPQQRTGSPIDGSNPLELGSVTESTDELLRGLEPGTVSPHSRHLRKTTRRTDLSSRMEELPAYGFSGAATVEPARNSAYEANRRCPNRNIPDLVRDSRGTRRRLPEVPAVQGPAFRNGAESSSSADDSNVPVRRRHGRDPGHVCGATRSHLQPGSAFVMGLAGTFPRPKVPSAPNPLVAQEAAH